MSEYMCISVTFLDTRYHGRGDGGEPEWPPSPLRLLQSIVAANANQIGKGDDLDRALRWLECQAPPTIIAPRHDVCSGYLASVPNNAMDIVGKAWSRGNYFGAGDANPATHRTMKTIRPVRMIEDDTVHYLWPLRDSPPEDEVMIRTIIDAAGRIVALGWGIDLVVSHGDRITTKQVEEMSGECWKPSVSAAACVLRTPMVGTLDALQERHDSFLHRIGAAGLTPVEPFSRFGVTDYRRVSDPLARPHVVFELRADNGSFHPYPQEKLVHIAGMVRHLAIEAMTHSLPPGIPNVAEWVDTYVAGHAKAPDDGHLQFSYLPLPSIGMVHTDPAVRRVMISAPVGDERLLNHLALRLSGQQLKPECGDEFGKQSPPTLVKVKRDKVAACYTRAADIWASVTPVILPGHDDHKPAKTVKLIERALAQSGIEQTCTFEWRAISWFPKSISAHKKPTGYIRPDHLHTQTAVHLKLCFENVLKVPGPLVIGAGRHCGLGLMAAID